MFFSVSLRALVLCHITPFHSVPSFLHSLRSVQDSGQVFYKQLYWLWSLLQPVIVPPLLLLPLGVIRTYICAPFTL